MELGYFDVGVCSAFIGWENRRQTPAVRTRPWNVEAWAGKLYVCVSFDRARCRQTGRTAMRVLAGAIVGFGIAGATLADAECNLSDLASSYAVLNFYVN